MGEARNPMAAFANAVITVIESPITWFRGEIFFYLFDSSEYYQLNSWDIKAHYVKTWGPYHKNGYVIDILGV